jgi:hypothetical protein
MTEFQAVMLTMAIAMVVMVIAFAVLAAVHANGAWMAIAFVVTLWLGADAAVRVERRYSDKERD